MFLFGRTPYLSSPNNLLRVVDAVNVSFFTFFHPEVLRSYLFPDIAASCLILPNYAIPSMMGPIPRVVISVLLTLMGRPTTASGGDSMPNFASSTIPPFEPSWMPSFEPSWMPSFAPSWMPSFEPSACTAGDEAKIFATRRSLASLTVLQSLNETISSPENSFKFAAGAEGFAACSRLLDKALPSVVGDCTCHHYSMLVLFPS